MTNARRHGFSIASSLLCAATAAAQAPAPAPASVEVVRVASKAVERQVKLPGEFRPYLAVPIHAKLPGFVKRVAVDRGSTVKQGQVLVTLEAPEMQAQITEAQSKAQALGLQRAEAEAKLAAAQSTYDRLKAASATPGVVAENDVLVAQKTAEAAQALVRSYDDSIRAAQAQVQSVKDLEQYFA
jgi:multidrug efflux pump subunit AcrA (membrane-fusion protein)